MLSVICIIFANAMVYIQNSKYRKLITLIFKVSFIIICLIMPIHFIWQSILLTCGKQCNLIGAIGTGVDIVLGLLILWIHFRMVKPRILIYIVFLAIIGLIAILIVLAVIFFCIENYIFSGTSCIILSLTPGVLITGFIISVFYQIK